MDSAQIASLSTALSNMQTGSAVGTLVLKKALDTRDTIASEMIQSIPQLPANPAIGRNINIAV